MSWTLFILLWFTSGTICTIVRICAFYRNKKVKEQCTSRTEATVIDIVISESTRTSRNGFERTVYFYFPVIEFYANGRVMREKLCIGYSYKKYKVGETITIFYNPNKPTEYFIEGDKSKKIHWNSMYYSRCSTFIFWFFIICCTFYILKTQLNNWAKPSFLILETLFLIENINR